MRHNINRKRLVAKQPKDVWVWDITYLYKDIEGEYFYLYAVMDLYSRKMMHWEVHTKQSDTLAAQFLENALKNNKIAVKGHLNSANITDDIIIRDSLVLHSDNGGPMKGQNMMVKAYALGLTTSYSRPRNSNDNAHIEPSFGITMNTCTQVLVMLPLNSAITVIGRPFLKIETQLLRRL